MVNLDAPLSQATIENAASRNLIRNIVFVAVVACLFLHPAAVAEQPANAEQHRWGTTAEGVRYYINAPAQQRIVPQQLVIFATPNGNTIEQTLGAEAQAGRDWHFDIQQIAAQTRLIRAIDKKRDTILAVVQAPKLSWPTFRSDHKQANELIRQLVNQLREETQADELVLTCHSGGGSFLWGFIESADALPDHLTRISFLDANYSFSNDQRHGDKLLAWLAGREDRRLFVLAYDDREITYNGKKVVGPDGGTFRATQRMVERFRKDLNLTEEPHAPFTYYRGPKDQVLFCVHSNPDNKILHTALVGEMNGYAEALLSGRATDAWGSLMGPRAYTQYVSADPLAPTDSTSSASIANDLPAESLAIPPRTADALPGQQLAERLAKLSVVDREAEVSQQIMQGNVPESVRRLIPVRIRSTQADAPEHELIIYVCSDYLAVGSDADSLRIPLTPVILNKLARQLHCWLPTPKLVDQLHEASNRRLVPRPMTENRESLATFMEHHQLIEQQLSVQRDRSPLASNNFELIAGHKKDVVLSNQLVDRPRKVAIYGWHFPTGRYVQPTTLVTR